MRDENNVNSTGLKSLDKLGKDRRVAEIFRDEDGIWLYTATGFYGGEDFALHIIHEDTAKRVLAKARGIAKCDCGDCKKETK